MKTGLLAAAAVAIVAGFASTAGATTHCYNVERQVCRPVHRPGGGPGFVCGTVQQRVCRQIPGPRTGARLNPSIRNGRNKFTHR
jgi:hypothetical protein